LREGLRQALAGSKACWSSCC